MLKFNKAKIKEEILFKRIFHIINLKLENNNLNSDSDFESYINKQEKKITEYQKIICRFLFLLSYRIRPRRCSSQCSCRLNHREKREMR